MADSSLDDFFAKKDKSKKKNKTKTSSKLTSSELMPPNEAEIALDKKKKKKKDTTEHSGLSGHTLKVSNVGQLGSTLDRRQDDAEWNDFEDENDKDYSGLRIQNLQISKEDETDDRDTQNDDDYEEGEDGERKEKESGPWKFTAKSAPEISEEVSPILQQVEVLTPSGRYVPPAARLAAKHGTASGPSSRRMKRTAPCINSQVDFPSLMGNPEDGNMSKGSGAQNYETVKGGNRQMQDTKTTVPVELGNKYHLLSKND